VKVFVTSALNSFIYLIYASLLNWIPNYSWDNFLNQPTLLSYVIKNFLLPYGYIIDVPLFNHVMFNRFLTCVNVFSKQVV
jgi:hypothetical protein